MFSWFNWFNAYPYCKCCINTIWDRFHLGCLHDVPTTYILSLLRILLNVFHLLLSRLDLLVNFEWCQLRISVRKYFVGKNYAIFWTFQFRIETYGWHLGPTLCIVLVTCKTTINVSEDNFIVNHYECVYAMNVPVTTVWVAVHVIGAIAYAYILYITTIKLLYC